MLIRITCRCILFVTLAHLVAAIMNGESLVIQMILCGIIGGSSAGGWND